MILVLNPNSAAGQARRKWKEIRPAVLGITGALEEIELNATTRAQVADRIRQGHREFIAAGGDGTVNWLADALLTEQRSQSTKLFLGAVGLGSSNDFHKPASRRCGGIPVRIDFRQVAAHDAGSIQYADEHGNETQRFWVVNSSAGITAEANHFFNHPDAILRSLKRHTTNLAILYAALRTIANHRPYSLTLSSNGGVPNCVKVTNLAIVKNPNVSGSFCYDSPFAPKNALFDVHLAENMNQLETLKLLGNLARKRFSGMPKTRSWQCRQIQVESNTPFAVEYDGEVIVTTRAQFQVCPGALNVCL